MYMELKEPFNFYTKVYFEIVYIARLILYVQHIGQSSNMKGVSLLQIFVVTHLWAPMKITTPFDPKYINLLLISPIVSPP
jgi:hypothetical protein